MLGDIWSICIGARSPLNNIEDIVNIAASCLQHGGSGNSYNWCRKNTDFPAPCTTKRQCELHDRSQDSPCRWNSLLHTTKLWKQALWLGYFRKVIFLFVCLFDQFISPEQFSCEWLDNVICSSWCWYILHTVRWYVLPLPSPSFPLWHDIMTFRLFFNTAFVFQLVLKHRQGKNHKMRIVVFVGSPVETDEKDVSHHSAMKLFTRK